MPADASGKQVMFALAPMSTDIRVMTYVMLLVPAGIVALAFFTPPTAFVALFFVAIYAGIFLFFRPTGFRIGKEALEIVWPLRRSSVPLAEIPGVEVISRAEFRRRYGSGMRVGAGGLWGGFGQVWTSREKIDFFVSRTDSFVLVRRRAGRSLLITPERPAEFADDLGRRLGAPGG